MPPILGFLLFLLDSLELKAMLKESSDQRQEEAFSPVDFVDLANLREKQFKNKKKFCL